MDLILGHGLSQFAPSGREEQSSVIILNVVTYAAGEQILAAAAAAADADSRVPEDCTGIILALTRLAPGAPCIRSEAHSSGLARS